MEQWALGNLSELHATLAVMDIRVLMAFAKIGIFLLMLGSGAMAILADEAGPWIFGVFPAVMVLGTLFLVVTRSMKVRAAMRAVDEDDPSASTDPS